MKIIALGTGTSQGIPIIGCRCEVCTSTNSADKRLRSSIFIEHQDQKILIDIGPDFRAQFLDNQLSTLDAILLTHEHNDHVVGLDEVRAINFIQRKSMPIYGESRVLDELTKRFPYAFSKNPYPGAPRIELNPIELLPFELANITVIPIRVKHGHLDILGYRIGDFAYITDASKIPEDQFPKLQNLKILVINALRNETHHSHFTLAEAIKNAQRINATSTYLTHISHTMGLTAEWSSNLPANIYALQDRMQLELS